MKPASEAGSESARQATPPFGEGANDQGRKVRSSAFKLRGLGL